MTASPALVERRRWQWRRSKRAHFERLRHDQGRCNRDRRRRCELLDPEPEPMSFAPPPLPRTFVADWPFAIAPDLFRLVTSSGESVQYVRAERVR